MERFIVLVLSLFILSGCTTKPIPEDFAFSAPIPEQEGYAGIYFYQYKSGILGAAYDVGLYIDGKKVGAINTGEYLYFEIPAGEHTYNSGFVLDKVRTENFTAGKSYFIRGFIDTGFPSIYIVKDPRRHADVIKFIESGRYKLATKD